MPIVIDHFAGRLPIHSHRWCDNGSVVQAPLYYRMADGVNSIAYNRRKAPIYWGGNFAALTGLSSVYIDIDFNPTGARPRWRAAMRTGDFVQDLECLVLVAPQNVAGPAGSDPYVRLAVTEVGGATITVDQHWGANETALTNTPDELRPFLLRARGPTANTEYTIVISDMEGSRLFAGVAYETPKFGTTENGYARRNYVVTQPIFDADRLELNKIATDLWMRNAFPAIGWSSDTDATAPTRVTSSYVNLIDTGVTTPAASTPGWTLDLRYRNRRTQTTVPCKLWVYAQNTTASGGDVRLLDSGGSALATLSSFSTVGEWKSTTVNLPATEAKYDAQFRGDGTNTFKVMALSLYPHA